MPTDWKSVADPGLILNQFGFDPIMVNQLQAIANATGWRQRSQRGYRPQLMQDRDLEDEAGWPKDVSIEEYRNMYERFGIASRVVNIFAEESWKKSPSLVEDDDPSVMTPFEMKFQELDTELFGESWHRDDTGEVTNIWSILREADKKSGIGHYSVLFLGFDDNENLSEPVAGLDENGLSKVAPLDRSKLRQESTNIKALTEEKAESVNDSIDKHAEEISKTEDKPLSDDELSVNEDGEETKLLYLQVYDESLAKISGWETDKTSPRFGLPTKYQITITDPMIEADVAAQQSTEMIEIHWTRVIHINERNLSSRVFHKPRMKGGYHHLIDLLKVFASSGEAYYQTGFPTTFFETHPQLGGDVLVDTDGLKDQWGRNRKGLERAMVLLGMTAKQNAPATTDPKSLIDLLLMCLCIEQGIPLTVFIGDRQAAFSSTSGGSDNERVWDERVRERQIHHVTPNIIYPLVNRLIQVGVLPPPEKGYSVSWPNLTNKTMEQRATAVDLLVKAIASYLTSGAAELIPPSVFLTHEMFLDLPDDEADMILQAARDLLASETDDEGFEGSDSEFGPHPENEETSDEEIEFDDTDVEIEFDVDEDDEIEFDEDA